MTRGQMVMFYGPMFSGKTGALLDVVFRAEERRERVAVLKPAIDQAAPGALHSHDGRVHAALDISTAEDIKTLSNGVDLVAIDEVQFLTEEIASVIRAIARPSGPMVVVAGLDRDFRGEPFAIVDRLLQAADKSSRLTAICSRCGRAAEYTQRLVDGSPAPRDGPVLLVGGLELYQPRCESCFLGERRRLAI
jgi:thymidine kinase